eukprot:scaffold58059_cov66-Phaeocystis_antarctica.AAC.5
MANGTAASSSLPGKAQDKPCHPTSTSCASGGVRRHPASASASASASFASSCGAAPPATAKLGEPGGG